MSNLEKPPVMILSYADSQSTEGNCMNDYKIGSDTGLIGSNKSLGSEQKYVFTLLKANGRDYIGYCGKSGARILDKQPWALNGGKQWKYIYESECHMPLEYLDAFSDRMDIDPKIFIRSKQFGHPNKNDYEQFWKVIMKLTSLPQEINL